MNEQTFFRLDGKVAFVTGGGQGIGEAICRRLARGRRQGRRVRSQCCRREPASRLRSAGIAVAGDVTSEADVETAVEDVREHLGPVDILVNNAGITGKAGKLWELSKDDWESVLLVNTIGPVLCCKAVVNSMRERKYGRIVNIASIAGKEGNPTLGPYSASKAAVICFTKSLAKELAGQGDITVNADLAGSHRDADSRRDAANDGRLHGVEDPMGRVGKPEEVAALVHFLASAEASFTTGQCYDISGGRATY